MHVDHRIGGMYQTDTRRAGDPAKKRREYLQRIADARSASFLWGCTAMGLAMVAMSGFQFALDYNPNAPTHIVSDFQLLRSFLGPIFDRVLPLFGMVPGTLAAAAVWASWFCRAKAREIDYVPTVAEQIAVLPASELLLRGSDETSTATCELLRVARMNPAEDLLRPESGIVGASRCSR